MQWEYTPFLHFLYTSLISPCKSTFIYAYFKFILNMNILFALDFFVTLALVSARMLSKLVHVENVLENLHAVSSNFQIK